MGKRQNVTNWLFRSQPNMLPVYNGDKELTRVSARPWIVRTTVVALLLGLFWVMAWITTGELKSSMPHGTPLRGMASLLASDDLTEASDVTGHMIVVAGHSVYMGHNFSDPSDNSNWYLLDYQDVPGAANSFVQHIRMGVLAAAEDPESILVFSGGYTREDAGAVSEGGSYYQVAAALDWFGKSDVMKRTLIEDRARDSLENILFSVCRYKQFTGGYPERYTFISYDFKKERFVGQHAAALGIPDNAITFNGTPALDPAGAKKGEQVALEAFKKDPYGCQGPLHDKRSTRDPFHYGIPDAQTCPALKPFLSGPCIKSRYRGPLPWRPAR